MKWLLRNIAQYGLGLYLLPAIVEGVTITGGVSTYFWSGVLLTVMFLFFRPIINLLTLPLNLATFGLFSFVTNVIILYFLTVFMPQITIQAFSFHGLTIFDVVIPHIYFNPFFAYIAASFVLSLLVTFIKWVTE